MKKQGIYCLLFICCICIGFTGGFFLGRNANHTKVQVSAVPSATQAPTDTATDSTDQSPVQGLVNINTATVAELQTLPNIGEVLAQRIVDYREANGPFASVAELTNVEGIGAKRLEALLDHITTGG